MNENNEESNGYQNDFFIMLAERLTIEGFYILNTLVNQHDEGYTLTNKEKIRSIVNQIYDKKENIPVEEQEQFIRTRNSMDIQMARLESAGLVDFTIVGKTKMYGITELGNHILGLNYARMAGDSK